MFGCNTSVNILLCEPNVLLAYLHTMFQIHFVYLFDLIFIIERLPKKPNDEPLSKNAKFILHCKLYIHHLFKIIIV